jgi:hypothetical protein
MMKKKEAKQKRMRLSKGMKCFSEELFPNPVEEQEKKKTLIFRLQYSVSFF